MINIHEVHAERQAQRQARFKPIRPKFWGLVIYREPFRKRIARHGVKQSDLNYGRVK